MPAGFCSTGGPAAAVTARAATSSGRMNMLLTFRVAVILVLPWVIRGGYSIGLEARALSSGELFDPWARNSSFVTPREPVQQEARSADALRATDCQAVSSDVSSAPDQRASPRQGRLAVKTAA